jgi:hypothetical protein
VGTKLRLVQCLVGPVAPERQMRSVLRVQSNAIQFERADGGGQPWLHFPKAADFRPTPNGFEVLEAGEIAARYEVSA